MTRRRPNRDLERTEDEKQAHIIEKTRRHLAVEKRRRHLTADILELMERRTHAPTNHRPS